MRAASAAAGVVLAAGVLAAPAAWAAGAGTSSVAVTASAAASTVARAAAAPPQRLTFADVGVTEKLGDVIPRDLTFTDETGKEVRLGDYLGKDRPLILTLNYSDCPLLCNVQLTGLVTGLRGLRWTPGKDYDLLTVSLDPREPVERAARSQQRYAAEFKRPRVEGGWHFLVGREENIRALAAAVGFRYMWSAATKEYVHQAAAMVIADDGTVRRYLYGADFSPSQLRFALMDADGGLGMPLERVTAAFMRYDAPAQKYEPALVPIGIAGFFGPIIVVGLLTWAVRRSKRPDERPAARPT